MLEHTGYRLCRRRNKPLDRSTRYDRRRLGRPVDQPRSETTRLGSYEIVRKLARGGMAELFLARTVGPEGFEKLVVLKKILPSHAENPKFVRLFLDEAKLAATLDHPHIAHVYDMGKVDGHYFFAMEYVHGQDVRTTMRRTARLNQDVPIDHAVQVARNVAAALHYAHTRTRADGTLLDIVHRDVSPSNILVSYDGAVKLVDFGVAKAATSTVKTRTGTLKGKISYMSPEQAKGAPIDRRSDIFSLGIVLWEMVTRQRLFKADNDLATIQMIINSKAQPPSAHRPDCPPELERITLRALAIEPAERYQTAEQLQLDLEELARGEKLKQSTVALRGFMHELFEDEIKAWSIAEAAGQTLTEHMLERATEMTTPVSESELYSLDMDDDDFDEDDENPSETFAQTMTLGSPTTQISVPPPPGRVTGPPQAATAGVLEEIAPTTEHKLHLAHEEPEPLPPVIASVQIDSGAVRNPTPFPIAPPEWRPSQGEITASIDLVMERRKRRLIGASIAFGTLVLLVITFAARNPRPIAAHVAEPPAPDKVEMKSSPTVDMTPTPVEADPAEKPVETPAPEAPQAPEEPAPPPAAGSAESSLGPKPPRATATKPTKPATASLAKAPATKPVASTAPKPATATKAMPPTTTKPTVTRPPARSADKKPYDPNSPLAPP